MKSLQPVLEEWIRLNQQYCRELNWQDCPWWANERASTGILGTAAWGSGGIALEEYITKKAKRKERGEKGHVPGRCDLFFTVGTIYFACEVKQIFPNLDRNLSKSAFDGVTGRFQAACKDARHLSRQEGRRLGICFVTPRFHASQLDNIETTLRKFLTLLKQEQEYDAMAWYFPKEACEMTWKENKRTYPGVVVLIKEVKRGFQTSI